MAETPMQKLKAVFEAKRYGTAQFIRFFYARDHNWDGKMNMQEFKIALARLQLYDITDEEVQQLFNEFDADKSDTIDEKEFLSKFRPELSDACLEVVKKAFSKFDKTGDGVITAEDLKTHEGDDTNFDAYLKTFEDESTTEGPVQVTEKEFIEYYTKLRADQSSDEFFIEMVKRAWSLD